MGNAHGEKNETNGRKVMNPGWEENTGIYTEHAEPTCQLVKRKTHKKKK